MAHEAARSALQPGATAAFKGRMHLRMRLLRSGGFGRAYKESSAIWHVAPGFQI